MKQFDNVYLLQVSTDTLVKVTIRLRSPARFPSRVTTQILVATVSQEIEEEHFEWTDLLLTQFVDHSIIELFILYSVINI